MKHHVQLLTIISTMSLVGAVVHAQQMIPVDGHRIRVQTGGLQHVGAGQPTIILESGGGAPLETWIRVFDKVARFAPVVAYDRPGNPNGLSEPDGQSPTPRHIAERLHSLLRELGLKPPYVLVGHSWGGPLIRMFTAVYPNEVAGLVYVDPTDIRTKESNLAYFRAQGYSDQVLKQQQSQGQQPAGVPRVVKEPYGEAEVMKHLLDSTFSEFRTLPPVADIPVSLLMSAKFDSRVWAGKPCEPMLCHEQWVRFRRQWLEEFLTGVTNSTFTIVTGTGHRIPHEIPIS